MVGTRLSAPSPVILSEAEGSIIVSGKQKNIRRQSLAPRPPNTDYRPPICKKREASIRGFTLFYLDRRLVAVVAIYILVHDDGAGASAARGIAAATSATSAAASGAATRIQLECFPSICSVRFM